MRISDWSSDVCSSDLLEGEDVLRTAAAMRALGADIERDVSGRWHVWGRGIGALAEPEDVLDMGNSGTGARLLLGILASPPLTAVLTSTEESRAGTGWVSTCRSRG